jgi:hypothetical protein
LGAIEGPGGKRLAVQLKPHETAAPKGPIESSVLTSSPSVATPVADADRDEAMLLSPWERLGWHPHAGPIVVRRRDQQLLQLLPAQIKGFSRDRGHFQQEERWINLSDPRWHLLGPEAMMTASATFSSLPHLS